MTFFKSSEPMLHFYHQDCLSAKKYDLSGGSWTISNPPELESWFCPWCGEPVGHSEPENLSPDSDVAKGSKDD